MACEQELQSQTAELTIIKALLKIIVKVIIGMTITESDKTDATL